MDHVATCIIRVVGPGRLVRLAICTPHLLFQVVSVGWARLGVDPVAPHAQRVAEHRVHGVDAVLHGRVCGGRQYLEASSSQQGNIRLAGIDALATSTTSIRVNANLAGFLPIVAVVLPVARTDLPNHVRGVVGVDDFLDSARIAIPQHMDDARHLAHVEVDADVQGLTIHHLIVAAVLGAVVGVINRAAGEVDELPVDVRLDQLRRIRREQAGDVIVGKVGFVIVGAGLNHAVHASKRRIITDRLHPLLIGELEAFWRGCSIRPIQTVIVEAQAGKDLPPRMLSLAERQRVQLIHVSAGNLEADDAFGLLHAAANGGAAIHAPTVKVNLFVDLGNLDPQSPVVRHFLDGREVDVADLRIARREVASMRLRMLPVVLARTGSNRPGLPSTEARDIASKFMG